jgi:hypothetical protein
LLTRSTLLLLVAGLLCAPAPALAGGAVLLPDVWIYLEASRYQPADLDQQWAGWIGAGAGLASLGGVTPYFSADVESLLGRRERPFEATQVNYHLEPGIRWPMGGFSGAIFFHHVSRHAVDRPKPEAVDWNILGLRLSGALGRSVGLHMSIGHTTQDSLVGYRWEFVAGFALDLPRPFYAAADLRYVTVEPDPAFPRSDFADVRTEVGGRWAQGRAVFEAFAAFERRNDVDLIVPTVRNRLLLGFRIGDRGRTESDIYARP